MTPEELDRAVSDALGLKLDPGFDHPAHEWGEIESCWAVVDESYGEVYHCLQDKQDCLRCCAERCTGTRCERDPVPDRCVRTAEKPKPYSSTVALALAAVEALSQAHGFLCWDLMGDPKGYAMNILCPGVTYRGEADSAAEAICRAIVAAVRRGA